MSQFRNLPDLVVLLGPTAVGKTALAIELAKRIGGEIISADSRLFYRGMDIGTAKPTPQEMSEVRHHLVDIVDPSETLSLAVFQRLVAQTVADITSRGKVPILVGGTGQYIRAITQGWEVPKQSPNDQLRSALENWGKQVGEAGLHARLAVLDPTAAAKIDPRNLRRTVRALEVIFSSGRPFSAQRRIGEPPYRALQLGLIRPRQELYARIDERIHRMIASGLVEEVAGLLDGGCSPDLPSLSAIGYSQIISYLGGEISLDDAVILIKRLTRKFVRRQANWFKPLDPNIQWFTVGKNTLNDLTAAVNLFIAN